MSSRLDRWRARASGDRPRLLVCRGGDCGSRRKHPGVDHLAQLARCRERLEGRVEVRATKCLDACEHSNVLVVVPAATARRAGIRTLWFGGVLDARTTDAVLEVALGTPGADADPVVRRHRFAPSARNLRHVDP